MLQAAPAGASSSVPPRRRFPRLRELVKFALIANAVACGLVAVPLTLAAAYHVERTGRWSAGPLVWRVLGIHDVAMVASLLLGAATPPLLIARRRRARTVAAVEAAPALLPRSTPARQRVVKEPAKW
ncbi:hypothetical protein ACFOMD_01980 [Sphingoaurantiacus capsulatus]|uniref:Lipoprotein n=1 Tax=Sphingoaurantiacus capsulatus TaxID=1771310 RepID=A0ABV7X7B9_9SPHN